MNHSFDFSNVDIFVYFEIIFVWSKFSCNDSDYVRISFPPLFFSKCFT